MPVIPIANPDDPRVADYRSLTDVALRRVTEIADGLYMAESIKVLERALRAGHAPRSVFTAEKWLGQAQDALRTAGAPEVPVYLVSDDAAESITGYAVHRGLLAAMHRPALPALSDLLADARTVLLLEDIVDHTNVGAAFRAAAGLGADAVLVTDRCADPLYRRSARVSMGTVFQVPWTRLARPTPGTDAAHSATLHDAGFELAALALRDDAIDLATFAASRPERVVLALGAEGDGLSRRTIEAADAVVTIPMAGGVDSLNVAAAAAVALWSLKHPPATSA